MFNADAKGSQTVRKEAKAREHPAPPLPAQQDCYVRKHQKQEHSYICLETGLASPKQSAAFEHLRNTKGKESCAFREEHHRAM